MKKNNIACIFLNGELNGSSNFYKKKLTKKNIDFFCADGGYKHALTLEIIPLEIWGDFDSISKDIQKDLINSSIKLITFPPEKNFTDGELLINYVYNKKYEQIIIIGGLGGRTSHTLTNLSLFAKYKNLIFLTEKEEIFYVNKNFYLENKISKIISFIPFTSSVKNICFEGFKFPLKNYTLKKGDSRCMSNIIISNLASIQYSSGILLGILENND